MSKLYLNKEKNIFFIFASLLIFNHQEIFADKNNLKIYWIGLNTTLSEKEKANLSKKTEKISSKKSQLFLDMRMDSCDLKKNRKLSEILNYNRIQTINFFLRGKGFKVSYNVKKRKKPTQKKCVFQIKISAEKNLDYDFDREDFLFSNVMSKNSLSPMTIHFSKNSLSLKSHEMRNLLLLTNNVIRNKNLQILIQSYTSSRGYGRKSLLLSQARAYFISDFFIRNGLSSNKISIKSSIIPQGRPYTLDKKRKVHAETNKVEISFIDPSKDIPIETDPIKSYKEHHQPMTSIQFSKNESDIKRKNKKKIITWLNNLNKKIKYNIWISREHCKAQKKKTLQKTLEFNQTMELIYLILNQGIKLNQIENKPHTRLGFQINKGQIVYEFEKSLKTLPCSFFLTLLPLSKLEKKEEITEKKEKKSPKKDEKEMQLSELDELESLLEEVGKENKSQEKERIISQESKGSNISEKEFFSHFISIYFSEASFRLSPKERKRLKKLLTSLLSDKKVALLISAYSDHQGSQKLNLELSKARSLIVVRYFLSQGVKSEKIGFEYSPQIFHHGPNIFTQAQKSNAKLRRVDVRLIPSSWIIKQSSD